MQKKWTPNLFSAVILIAALLFVPVRTEANPLIGAGLSLATKIFERSNNKEKRRYIDELVTLEKSLRKELSRPLDSQNDKKS